MSHHPLCMTLWSGEPEHCECPEVNTCRACPDTCKQCTWEQETCDCYEHEEQAAEDEGLTPVSELFKTVTLDRLRVGISQRLSAELPFIAETAAVEWLPDHIAGDLDQQTDAILEVAHRFETWIRDGQDADA